MWLRCEQPLSLVKKEMQSIHRAFSDFITTCIPVGTTIFVKPRKKGPKTLTDALEKFFCS